MALQEHGEVRDGVLPRRREDLEPICTGRMGPAFYRWRFAPADLPAVLGHDWSPLGRRVFIDPGRGEVTLMAPSGPHESTSWFVGYLVFCAAESMAIDVVPARATTWRPPGSRRVEADESFYLGEAALRHRDVQDEDGSIAFLDANPPQLVIEVERADGDAGKSDVYRDLGVAEMWRIDARRWPALTAEVLGLQRAQGARAVDRSAVLSGLTPALIVQALDLARRKGIQAVPGLLTAAGIGRKA